jgi:leader peptidase (prepilin peptidase) / N-methyltransferase
MSPFQITVSLYPFFPYILFGVIGALIGSFLNVVIYRLPQGLSIVTPASRCGHCNKPIPFYLNIPIFGWLFLLGKTACCGKPYSIRYPLVEALTSVCFIVCWMITHSFIPAVIFSLFSALLICAFFTDWDTMTIPDVFSYAPVLISSVILYALILLKYPNASDIAKYSLSGLLLGSGSLLWIALLTEWYLKKEPLGMGDIKLMGMVGIFLGPLGVCLAIFGGAIITLLFKMLRLKPKALSTDIANPGEFPFGPGLCLASLLVLFFLPCINNTAFILF